MTTGESWVYQGRQSHGWFGDGTAPHDNASDTSTSANKLFEPINASQRVDYVAFSIIGHVPRGERGRWTSALSDSTRDRLKTAVAAWYGASALSRNAFRTELLDPYTTDETVDHLRNATRGMVEGRTYDDLAKAGKDLAAAAQQVGVDRWSRFLGDADQRAMAAVSENAIPGVVKAGYTGTGTLVTGVFLLGKLFLYLARKSGEQAPTKTSTPALMAAPPRDAKNADGAKAPGKPGPTEGFQDPKGGENWVPSPNGNGSGWLDAEGNVWVPTGPGGRAHGGPHWDVQSPDGKYKNVYPGGTERSNR